MKSSKLPIIIFVLLGLSIIAFQYTQNAKLKKELKAQNSKEIGSSGEGSLTLAGTGKGVSKSSSDSKKGSVTKKDSKNLSIVISSVNEILSDPDPLKRIERLMAYVNKLSPDEMPDALVALQESAPDWDPHMKMAVGLLLTRWASADSDAAFAYVEQMKNKDQARDCLLYTSPSPRDRG